MTALDRIARLHRMDAVTWERHGNPWSVWTRVPLLPLFALAIWSRAWIGWGVLLPLVALALWTWVNPRAFPPPATTARWSAKAVMGERIWLNRSEIPVPGHHARMVPVTVAVAMTGLPFLVWGLWRLEVWPLLLGLVLAMLGKF